MAVKIIPERISHCAGLEIYFKEHRNLTISLFYKSFPVFLVICGYLAVLSLKATRKGLAESSRPLLKTRGSSSEWEAAAMWLSRAGPVLAVPESTQVGERHPTLSNAHTLPLGITLSSSCVTWQQQALRASQNPGSFIWTAAAVFPPAIKVSCF